MYLQSCVFLHFCFFLVDKWCFFNDQSGFIRNYRMGALAGAGAGTTVNFKVSSSEANQKNFKRPIETSCLCCFYLNNKVLRSKANYS